MNASTTLADFVARWTPDGNHRPWPHVVVDEPGWRSIAERLGGGTWDLLGFFADSATVHAVLREAGTVAVASLPCSAGRFPSLGRTHAPAIRLERSIRDLFGLDPEGLGDTRPWLDHGRWGRRAPLGGADASRQSDTSMPYRFLPAEGESLHQIPVGPVHAGTIEPGHFRFTASGETVIRVEQRFGYAHKGIESLMAGAGLQQAAMLAGRTSGDSTVAYALAFARAAEAALEVEPPARAHWLRALLAELERVANHLGDIGGICNDASFALMLTHCGILREHVLRAADRCFGHRLMRDLVVPGGVNIDLDDAGREALRTLVRTIRERFPELVDLYENTASLQDRTVGTGVLTAELAREYAAGGYIGRASGRTFDARRDLCYPPYDQLEFEVPGLAEGDVDARVWIRIREIEQSLALIDQLLAGLPAGATRAGLPAADASGPCEGIAVVEGFRGDVLAWLRLGAGQRVERCHLRDPSWFQWPLLEAAIEGNIVADFPLCNKSFNCSYSGHDL